MSEHDDTLTWRARLGIWLGLASLFVGFPTAIFLWMTAVPGESYPGPVPLNAAPVQAAAARLQGDVTAIASKPHNLKHSRALREVQAYLTRQLETAGYSVAGQDVLLPAQNLEVVVNSADSAARTLVIGAHFDSYGPVAGANDNASGTAALLELARRLKPLDGKSNIRVRLVFFANEEPPFFKSNAMGSVIAAAIQQRRAEHVIGMISLETIGYYSDRPGSQLYPFPLSVRYPGVGNFIAFVGDLSSRAFLRRSIAAFRSQGQFPSVGGTAPSFVQGIDWSDHWSYAQQGIPSFMITDTAPFRYPYYHEAGDTPDKLDYRKMAVVVDGLESMIIALANSD